MIMRRKNPPRLDVRYLRRNPAQGRLWRALVELNDRGEKPTKLRLLEYSDGLARSAGEPIALRTYGGGYRMIDALIASGWITNEATTAHVYRLRANVLEGQA